MNSNGGKIFFVAILIAVGVSTYLRSSNRAATERLEQSTKQLQQKAQALMQRQLAGEEVGDEHEKLFNEFIAEAEKASNETNGQDAKALKAIVITMRDLQGPMKNYNTTFATLMAAGGGAPEGIKAKADVEARLVMIEKLRVVNDELDDAYKAIPDRLQANLKAAGISDSEIFKAVTSLRATAKLDTVAKIRQTDRDLVAAMRGQFELLKADFGKWKLVEGGAVEFQNPASGEKFDKLYHDIQAAAQLQEKLQREAMTK